MTSTVTGEINMAVVIMHLIGAIVSNNVNWSSGTH